MSFALGMGLVSTGAIAGFILFALIRRPEGMDEAWMHELLNDLRNSENAPPITIQISRADLELLNNGRPLTMQGPVIIIPPAPEEGFHSDTEVKS